MRVREKNGPRTSHAVTRCRKCFPRQGSVPRPGTLGLVRIGTPVGNVAGRNGMRRILIGTALSTAAVMAAGSVYANEELIKLSQDAKQWVMPAANYANTRHSMLKQITADNVGKLQVAWTFSTGVLRGHEGAPLVIGDMMYLHGPFPNPVYALDLKNENKIVWKYEPTQDPN